MSDITPEALKAAGFEQADNCFLWCVGEQVRFGVSVVLQDNEIKTAGISIGMGQFFVFARAEVFPIDMEGIEILKGMLTPK